MAYQQHADLLLRHPPLLRPCVAWDVFGTKHAATVIDIDLQAEHGAGRITVQYDDGRVSHVAACAHGLEAIAGE